MKCEKIFVLMKPGDDVLNFGLNSLKFPYYLSKGRKSFPRSFHASQLIEVVAS